VEERSNKKTTKGKKINEENKPLVVYHETKLNQIKIIINFATF